MFSGCTALSQQAGESPHVATLDQARTYLEAGQYYEARKEVGLILKDHPADNEAQKLMADILDKELTWQKEVVEDKAPEEWTKDQKDQEARTWIERAEQLLELGQYDQALEAAERVFVYDPDNIKASSLIDKIRKSAYKQGKKDMGVVDNMRLEEVQVRVERYRKEAKEYFEDGRLGEARLTVQKWLLLEPEDKEGLKLSEEIEARMNGQHHEERKTL